MRPGIVFLLAGSLVPPTAFCTDRNTPQPVLAWAQGPRELGVVFDQPIHTESLRDLVGKIKITGERGILKVLGVQITHDFRTLILTTAPHAETTKYTLTLP